MTTPDYLAFKSDLINPNLLHNWYFPNPVNRNGLMEYIGTRYGIDRWKIYHDHITNKLVSNGIEVFFGRSWYGLYQPLENSNELAGKTVTYSALLESSDGNVIFKICDGTTNVSNKTFEAGEHLVSFTTTLPTSFTSGFAVAFQGLEGVTAVIKAVKLELGDTQTLAHQNENGNWVLNEIPDYAEQYSICCQYDKTSGAYLGLTPEAVGALPVYTELSEIGLTVGSETIESIATNLPAFSRLIIDISSSNASIYPVQYGGLEVQKWSGENRVLFSFFPKASGGKYFGVYDSTSSYSKWSGWKEVFLADGSVPMSGNLNIDGGTAYRAVGINRTVNNKVGTVEFGILSSGGYPWVKIGYRLDSTELAGLRFRENILQFIDATGEPYDIYGTHNITAGTADLTAGTTALATGCYYDVYK